MSNYYCVVAKCGHVGGPGKYIPIPFPVVAESGVKAAELVRNKPRVKHDHKDAILSVTKVTFEGYQAAVKNFYADPYVNCFNPQQQREIWELIEDRVCDEPIPPDYRKAPEPNPRRSVRYGHGYDDKQITKYNIYKKPDCCRGFIWDYSTGYSDDYFDNYPDCPYSDDYSAEYSDYSELFAA